MAERNTKRTLWMVLSGLIILIVALIVGIVIYKVNEIVIEDNDETIVSMNFHAKELFELNEEAAELPVEEAKLLYEDAILNAPTELIREQTKVEYGRYLISQDLTEEGLNKLLTANEEVLEVNYKVLLYAALRDYFYTINDDELYSKYSDMISEVIRNSDFAVGG